MSKKNIIIVIVLVVVVAALVVFVSRQPQVEKEQGERVAGAYDEFAQCLYSNGMRMYGSVTCSLCARQRALFGNSFDLIKEIECDPRNDDSQTELCIEKNISHTPTWIFEGKDENNVHRFEPGLISLKKLSEVSGCPLPVNS